MSLAVKPAKKKKTGLDLSWFTCNHCGQQFSRKADFQLTNCEHIVCRSCLPQSSDGCPVCGKQCQTIAIGKNMRDTSAICADFFESGSTTDQLAAMQAKLNDLKKIEKFRTEQRRRKMQLLQDENTSLKVSNDGLAAKVAALSGSRTGSMDETGPLFGRTISESSSYRGQHPQQQQQYPQQQHQRHARNAIRSSSSSSSSSSVAANHHLQQQQATPGIYQTPMPGRVFDGRGNATPSHTPHTANRLSLSAIPGSNGSGHHSASPAMSRMASPAPRTLPTPQMHGNVSAGGMMIRQTQSALLTSRQSHAPSQGLASAANVKHAMPAPSTTQRRDQKYAAGRARSSTSTSSNSVVSHGYTTPYNQKLAQNGKGQHQHAHPKPKSHRNFNPPRSTSVSSSSSSGRVWAIGNDRNNTSRQ